MLRHDTDYEKVGTRELLLRDRDPWQLELYQLQNDKLSQVGTSTLQQADILTSSVLPLTFRLTPGQERPMIEIVATDGKKQWLI